MFFTHTYLLHCPTQPRQLAKDFSRLLGCHVKHGGHARLGDEQRVTPHCREGIEDCYAVFCLEDLRQQRHGYTTHQQKHVWWAFAAHCCSQCASSKYLHGLDAARTQLRGQPAAEWHTPLLQATFRVDASSNEETHTPQVPAATKTHIHLKAPLPCERGVCPPKFWRRRCRGRRG